MATNQSAQVHVGANCAKNARGIADQKKATYFVWQWRLV
jgi:hypothetical protein